MKKPAIFYLIIVAAIWMLTSNCCFAQSKPKPKMDSLTFDAYAKGEMEDFEASFKQLEKVYKQVDSSRLVFLRKYLYRNKVDLTRLSNHQDSLIITNDKIKYILKPKKK